jgi:predicted TIM-barrel fold metal-dependent hydrolase
MTGIVDVHHHYICEHGYLDGLLREMDRLGIEKTGLMAMGPLFERLFVTTEQTCGALYEADVLKAIQQWPDRFYGYVYVRLGDDGPDKVRQWGEQGFAAVKFHIPREAYSHYDYFPVYEAARDLNMFCLFHTGFFYLPNMVGQRVHSDRCRPIHVEAIVNELPDLRVILAHLGTGAWAEEACALMRIHPNVYADMSGRVDGWRSSKPISWFQQMLYWPGASDKLLFGSDVHYSELAETLEDHVRILVEMGWGDERIKKFLTGNAQRLMAYQAKPSYTTDRT